MGKSRLSRLIITALVSLTAVLAPAAADSAYADSYMQALSDTNLRGIDVSHWDGAIDWQQVKASGISFAYLKASAGDSITDPYFADNVKNARAAGLPIGAYHYAQPSTPFDVNQAREEAQFFVNVMKQNGLLDYGDIMPVLDLEEPAQTGLLTPTELAQWARAFIDTAKSLTNRQILLYTGVWFVQQNNDFGGVLADLPLWVADYTYYGDPQPPACGGWTQWTIWQHTDEGSVPGVAGTVDLDAGPASLDVLKGNLLPAAPTGFAASGVTSGSVNLTWNAVQGATSYSLQRNGTSVYSGSAGAFTDSNLSGGTAYTYSLTATNANGASEPVSLNVTTLQNRLSASVKTGKSTYYRRSYAKITENVKDSSGHVVKGAAVTVTVANRYGIKKTVTGTTNAYGNFSYSYYIPSYGAKGTYTVTAHAALINYVSSDVKTTFYVI